MKAEIIAVGDGVVYGHTINTNASYLAREVQDLGMEITYISAVCDQSERIREALKDAMKRSDLIIFTGGLGPTPDDLTKEIVCQELGLSMQIIPKELEKIKAYFTSKGRQMTSNNEKQAAFPKEAIILPNDCGTAPGCLLKQDHKMIILLPGPPKEMKCMFTQYVVPYLDKVSNQKSGYIDIRCFGIGESELAQRIDCLIGKKGQRTIATYVSNQEVIVRITAYGMHQKEVDVLIEEGKNQIENRLEPFIIGYNDERLEEKIVEKLLERKLTISTVESCTGGLIAATLVNCGGVSSCFKEGVVTYSNEAKTAYVGVKEETLARVGAVSEETAKEMAEGIRRKAKVDIGLASTGIAGPGGGTLEKPVGLVYIGIAMPDGTDVIKLQLSGTRQEIREKTVKHILFHLYKKLQ